MGKFQNKYCIPSARANWHNYNGGVYFVTICTNNREHYFGEICPGPQMQLSPIGQYAYNQFINVKTHYPYAKIPLFVIMPDHIHAIVTIDGENEIGGNGVHTQCRDVARNVCNENIARDACGNGVHAQCRDIARRCRDVARNVSTGVNTQMANISPRKNSLAVVIRGVKSSITKFANEKKIPFAWQTRFHDRIIRNQAELDRISDYIEKNVVNWHDDL
jgi:REP element-mobilizing transposase RayT